MLNLNLWGVDYVQYTELTSQVKIKQKKSNGYPFGN